MLPFPELCGDPGSCHLFLEAQTRGIYPLCQNLTPFPKVGGWFLLLCFCLLVCLRGNVVVGFWEGFFGWLVGLFLIRTLAQIYKWHRI